MSRLTILLHIRASGGGGAERVFAILANGLAERGHDVTLAVDEIVDADALSGAVRLVDLGRAHVRGVLHLAFLIARRRPDVLVAGVAVSNVKLALARLMALSRAPLVLSYHGFEEHKTGRISAFAYYGMPFLRRVTTCFICVSDALRTALVGEWGAPPARTGRIYNPVPLPCERPSLEAIAARPPLVGAVGRLSAEKGMDVLLRAFARMRTPDARLMIGGDGPERGRLQRLADRLGCAARVEFLGRTPGPGAVFGRARVAAIPSYTEAFGMTTVEALAHGLPVVATDCDGPREILEENRYGRLVPVGDAEALAAALDEALARPHDPTLGYQRAAEFSEAVGIDRWERLLVDLVDARRR